MESPNTRSLSQAFIQLGMEDEALVRAFRGINAYREPFRKASEAHEK
jgi:hypothetical protein